MKNSTPSTPGKYNSKKREIDPLFDIYKKLNPNSKPSKGALKNILSYSKALEVYQSKQLTHIENLLN